MATSSSSSATAETSDAFPGKYSEPFTRDYARLRTKITRETCATLQEQGYVVLDECFGHGWATALLDEMKWLHAQQHFKPNKTQFALTQTTGAAPQVVQFVKPHIFEVDLHDAVLRGKVPELDALFHSTALLEVFSEHMPEYDLQWSTSGRTLKLQRNAGHGGCFPCHYDNPGKPNMRKLTCLLYLNDAWRKGDGGEVQLLPFLKQPVTVAPRMDRMVIFMSDWMLHRVLPSRAERYCLTIWLDGGASAVNTPVDTELRIAASDMADWFGFLERLRKSPVQRLLSRGVYADEYRESLTQCMHHDGHAAGFVEMLRSHETHLVNVARNAPLANFISRLRDVRAMNCEAPVTID